MGLTLGYVTIVLCMKIGSARMPPLSLFADSVQQCLRLTEMAAVDDQFNLTRVADIFERIGR